MDWGAEYVGVFLLAVGGLLAYWKRKRKFDRTDQCGIERFPSYGKKAAGQSHGGPPRLRVSGAPDRRGIDRRAPL